jgi:hypothetical protein
MLELGPYGSVRGARGNSRPYREPGPKADFDRQQLVVIKYSRGRRSHVAASI